jgi:anaerobic selenocysteine-containing dehydrogenase
MTIEIKKSFCHLCLAECGIKVTIEDNRFIKILPDYDDPVSKGYICEKAQKLIEFQSDSNRITSPFKKVNDKFIPVSWEQAIDEISAKLQVIINNGRAKNILYMAPLVLTYHSTTFYSYELVKRLGVQYTTNVFSYEKMYQTAINAQLFKGYPVPDRDNAQTLLVIGANPWITHHYPRARQILNSIKNDLNRTLIVIDPCSTETTKIADHHIKLKPGTDAWFLSALIKVLIENEFVDQTFIAMQTTNYNKIVDYFAQINLTEYLHICGVTLDQLTTVATIINSSNGLSIDNGNGMCHSLNQRVNFYLIGILYAITGNYKKTGSMQSTLFMLQKYNHYFNDPFTPFTKHAQFNGVIPASLIADNLYVDDINCMDCVIIDNANPAEKDPNSIKFAQQLKKVGLVIALDSFATATTKLADYILPTQTFYERIECATIVTSTSDILRASEQVVATDYAKQTSTILRCILDKIGLSIDTTQYVTLYKTDQLAFFKIMLEKFANREPIVYTILCDTIGTQYNTDSFTIMWWNLFQYNCKVYVNDMLTAITVTTTMVNRLAKTEPITVDNRIDRKTIIDLAPDNLFDLLQVSAASLTHAEYSFVLQCGYRQKSAMNGVIPNTNAPVLEVDIADLVILNINNGDKVMLQTDTTELVIDCKGVTNLQPGLIRIANHPIINRLTSANNVDYLNPQYKFVFANIRKINGNM